MRVGEIKILKGKKLAEGKAKIIWQNVYRNNYIIVENKADIAAFDDKSYTKQFASKAIYATKTTCRVFELLNEAGISTSFIRHH